MNHLSQNQQQTPKNISKDLIQSLLPQNPVIIEAGAHIGRDTIKLAKRYPEGTIYSFEPAPHIFTQLTKHVAPYENVHIFNYALDNNNGSAAFFLSGGSSHAASSLLQPKTYLQERKNSSFSEPITVETITLDTWAKKHAVTQVDFMWLDLQGAELRALQGAEKLLQTVSVIHTEVNLTERYEGAVLYNDLRLWLEDQGFELVAEEISRPTWGNALFKRK